MSNQKSYGEIVEWLCNVQCACKSQKKNVNSERRNIWFLLSHTTRAVINVKYSEFIGGSIWHNPTEGRTKKKMANESIKTTIFQLISATTF